MRERLLRNVNACDFWQKADATPTDMSAMSEMQWDSEEWQYMLFLMKNRMLMGGYRYDCIENQLKQGGNKYNNIGSAIKRLKKFQETGNKEFLIDAANLCLIEFVVGSHPKKHFNPIDDDIHVERTI